MNINLLIVGQDFDNNGGPYNITIPAALTSTSLHIAIIDNNILEINENFTLTIVKSLMGSGNVTIGDISQTTVIILDDDGK